MDQPTIQELSSTGNHQECLQACQQLLQSEPENPLPWKYAGKSLLALGQFEKAQQYLIKAHQHDPKDPETIKDIGNIFNALQNDAEAIRLYKAALSIEQNYAPAINNLGLIAKRQGKLVAAEQLVKRACDLDQSFAPYHMNLGGIYKNLGKLDQALASTLKSLELKPNNPDALMNLGMTYETLNDLDSALESYTESANLIAQRNESSLTSLISASTILLQMNRAEDAKKALSKALAIAVNETTAPKQGSIKNKKNNNAYLSYLSKLIPEIPTTQNTEKPQILHLGESHCLAFTNQTIEFEGEKCVIKPSLVKGAKAFHLSEESKTNLQKIGFKKRLQQNLDDYKYIFLSFGEIDCREDEGILSYCSKSGKAIQDVSKTTATKYFEWTTTLLAKYKDKLVYFGTPAPLRIGPNHEESSESNKQRLLAITIFNSTLASHCQESGAIFANVYELTASKDGYNNNEWMIDARHL